MSPADISKLLAIIQAYDNRVVDEVTVAAWCAVFEGTGIRFEDARQAVVSHNRDSTEYLKPAHVVAIVRQSRAAVERATMSQRVEDCTDLGRAHRRLADGTCMLCEHRVTV